jgi:predicted metal-binding protein
MLLDDFQSACIPLAGLSPAAGACMLNPGLCYICDGCVLRQPLGHKIRREGIHSLAIALRYLQKSG